MNILAHELRLKWMNILAHELLTWMNILAHELLTWMNILAHELLLKWMNILAYELLTWMNNQAHELLTCMPTVHNFPSRQAEPFCDTLKTTTPEESTNSQSKTMSLEETSTNASNVV